MSTRAGVAGRSRSIPITSRARRDRVAVALALAAASIAGATAAGATAAEVGVPASPPPPPPAAAPPPPAPAPAPAASAPSTVRRVAAPIALRVGSRGPAVRDLQRALRSRGFRIAVDGAFGPATRRAVRGLQGRLKLRPTGIADARLLKRLGLRTRTTAGARRVVPVAPSRYLTAFPVGGDHAYSDDWGAPRPQGGHQGTDILADRNTPVIAADTGVVSKISRAETGRGGVYLWLRRPAGIQFYYAHMESIAEGVELGTAVSAGQVIGAVGNSGDARFGPTHLHFEIRREWTPFNPYPELVGVDPGHAPRGN